MIPVRVKFCREDRAMNGERDLEGMFCKLISAVETMKRFDRDSLTGLFPEMHQEELDAFLRQYVFSKGIVPRISINYGRLGLLDTRIVVDFSKEVAPKAHLLLEELSRSGYLISWQKPLGLRTYVTRHAIPMGFAEEYDEMFGSLLDLGYVSEYELLSFEGYSQRFSLHPYVFDYMKGDWKATFVPVVESERRLAGTQSNEAAKFDRLDLEILGMLKRSAVTDEQIMAESLGVSVAELEEHLVDHVVKRGLVLSLYLDFMDAELFAGRTTILSVLARVGDSGPDVLARGALAIPYLAFMQRGAKAVDLLFEFPVERTFSLSDEVGGLLSRSGVDSASFFLSRWRSLNMLTDEKHWSELISKFKDGRWTFDAQAALRSIEARLAE